MHKFFWPSQEMPGVAISSGSPSYLSQQREDTRNEIEGERSPERERKISR
jgi:hypothetical protein